MKQGQKMLHDWVSPNTAVGRTRVVEALPEKIKNKKIC